MNSIGKKEKGTKDFHVDSNSSACMERAELASNSDLGTNQHESINSTESSSISMSRYKPDKQQLLTKYNHTIDWENILLMSEHEIKHHPIVAAYNCSAVHQRIGETNSWAAVMTISGQPNQIIGTFNSKLDALRHATYAALIMDSNVLESRQDSKFKKLLGEESKITSFTVPQQKLLKTSNHMHLERSIPTEAFSKTNSNTRKHDAIENSSHIQRDIGVQPKSIISLSKQMRQRQKQTNSLNSSQSNNDQSSSNRQTKPAAAKIKAEEFPYPISQAGKEKAEQKLSSSLPNKFFDQMIPNELSKHPTGTKNAAIERKDNEIANLIMLNNRRNSIMNINEYDEQDEDELDDTGDEIDESLTSVPGIHEQMERLRFPGILFGTQQ